MQVLLTVIIFRHNCLSCLFEQITFNNFLNVIRINRVITILIPRIDNNISILCSSKIFSLKLNITYLAIWRILSPSGGPQLSKIREATEDENFNRYQERQVFNFFSK